MRWFNMSKDEYKKLVEQKSPNSETFRDALKAFLSGGLICCVGQGFYELYSALGILEETCGLYTSISMIFLGALLTGLGLYDNIAKFAGAGSLVPITGFANSVASPALEFKTEGFILGTGAKMFIIAGPVIVYGISTSIIYGLILYLLSFFNLLSL